MAAAAAKEGIRKSSSRSIGARARVRHEEATKAATATAKAARCAGWV